MPWRAFASGKLSAIPLIFTGVEIFRRRHGEMDGDLVGFDRRRGLDGNGGQRDGLGPWLDGSVAVHHACSDDRDLLDDFHLPDDLDGHLLDDLDGDLLDDGRGRRAVVCGPRPALFPFGAFFP